MSKAIEQIVVGFHTAVDRGLPCESLPKPLKAQFIKWVGTNYPEVAENADVDDLEGYLIDEHEGVGPIVDFFKTLPAKNLPAIFKDFRKRIDAYYSNSTLDPEDELEKAAIDTRKRIDAFLRKQAG